MRAEEFIARLTETAQNEKLHSHLCQGVPLGVDAANELVLSQTREHAYTARHTCVTGTRKTQFIRRLISHISALYPKTDANLLILSPYPEYGEALKYKYLDATVPYVRSKADLALAKTCIRELAEEYSRGAGYPTLFLVLDGLEELPECGQTDLEEYRSFIELVAREKNVHVISGVDLMKSIFSGNPGVFVGVGNCIVTTREEGRADVTYVENDYSLSMPIGMTYPDMPSHLETIIHLNSLPALSKKQEK